MHVVTDFFQTTKLPEEVNNTFLALIPKKSNPTLPQDFRPISLCNVIYKIITKTLADRIKSHPPNIIHPTQSAFVQGRRISTNIIITQEIVHSFNLSSWNHKAFLLKIDLAKAFEYIYPSRGIRQGCPLSPYLFVIGINELSDMLQTALQNSNISEIQLGHGGPNIHSLLFVDDLIICGHVTPQEATITKNASKNNNKKILD
jgi:hypothetical protein